MQYDVSLTIPVDADSPEEAVHAFNHLLEREDWCYEVKDSKGKAFFVDTSICDDEEE
jgi:hypothetical protein